MLFLDELPEFGQQTLDVLRQPLEDRIVTISRASGSITFPANFIADRGHEPCPCGYAGDAEKQCTCSPSVVARYQKRISGPLIDRIDIHVEVPRVNYDKLASERQGEPSSAVRERVTAARVRQAERFKQHAPADQRRTWGRPRCAALPARWRGPAADAGGHAPAAPLGARLPPRAQAGAHDRRPGRRGGHRAGAPGRGDPVPAEEGGVIGLSKQRQP